MNKDGGKREAKTMLKCYECRVNWTEVIDSIRNREAYVYPMLYHEFFSLARDMIQSTYLTTERIVMEDGARKCVTYVHIPFIDLTNDLVLMIQWTGSKRFDTSSLENTLYKVRYSRDVKRFKSKIESCNFIHTHGRFQRVPTTAADTLVRKYMLFKSGLWRYTTTEDCRSKYGQFAYTNCVSLSVVHREHCIDNSVGFITGKPHIRDNHKLLSREESFLNAYVFRPKSPYASLYLYEYTIDAVHIILRKGSYEGLGIGRRGINVYSPIPLEEKGMFLVVSPKISHTDFKPLVIGTVPESELPKYLSAHALLYAFIFAMLNEGNTSTAKARVVKSKYERIVDSPARTLGVTPLPFEEVLELCWPLIDYIDNKQETLALLKTHAALSLIGSRSRKDDYFLSELIMQRSAKRPYLSVGLENMRETLSKGCSLIF